MPRLLRVHGMTGWADGGRTPTHPAIHHIIGLIGMQATPLRGA
ncbi:MAG: hypothetical protein ACK5S9_09900 [Roseiflexaceae bacterium]